MMTSQSKWIDPSKRVSDVSNANAASSVGMKSDPQPHPNAVIASLGSRGGFNQKSCNKPFGEGETPIAAPVQKVTFPTVTPGDSIQG
jgi:hypothetical protein